MDLRKVLEGGGGGGGVGQVPVGQLSCIAAQAEAG